jgi:hypothetical protein
VAVSRARHDIQIYTGRKAELTQALPRVSHRTALESVQREIKAQQSIGH